NLDPALFVARFLLALCLVPRTNLVERELERGPQVGVERAQGVDALSARHLEIVELATVEPGGQAAQCGVPLGPHFGDDRRDRSGHVVAGRGRAREPRTQVAGNASEDDTSEHRKNRSYRPDPFPPGRLRPFRLWHTPLVSTTSDLATLSSIVAQVDELSRRVTELAERYGDTPDSAVASELFTSERSLTTARR